MKRKRDLFIKSICLCLISGGIILICGYILNGATLKTTPDDHESIPWYQVVDFY